MKLVPRQLLNEKFIVLQERGKFPVQKWSNPAYQFNAEKIQKWIEHGWNYAVLYQTDLCLFDADNAEKLNELGILDALPETFTVRSGRENLGYHLYFRMPNPPEGTKIYIYDDDGNDLGDIRLPHSRFYNVGPGSIHPSGREYTIEKDIDIAVLEWDVLKSALSNVVTKVAGVSRKIDTAVVHKPSTLDEYGFTVLDFLKPLNPQVRGDEIEGTHPIHGSSTGNNLTVKADGSVWWCRRCGSGGNWIDALAVSNGIIDCADAHPGRIYSKKQWKEINQILHELKPDVYERLAKEWRVAQSTAALNNLKTALSEVYPNR